MHCLELWHVQPTDCKLTAVNCELLKPFQQPGLSGME